MAGERSRKFFCLKEAPSVVPVRWGYIDVVPGMSDVLFRQETAFRAGSFVSDEALH